MSVSTGYMLICIDRGPRTSGFRLFGVAWETESRQFQSALWDCFGDAFSIRRKQGGNSVPQNSPTIHFKAISTRSPAQPQSGE